MGRPETFTKHDVGVIKKYYAKIPTKQLVGMMENMGMWMLMVKELLFMMKAVVK